MYLSLGRGGLELAQTLLRVALAWHFARSSTPKDLWVNNLSSMVTEVTKSWLQAGATACCKALP